MDGYLLLAVVMTFAFTVQSAFGFGLALIAVPLLSLQMPVTSITPLLSFLSLLMSIVILVRQHTSVARWLLLPLLLGTCTGIPIGVWFVTHVEGSLVRLILGIFVALSSIWALLVAWRTQADAIKEYAPAATSSVPTASQPTFIALGGAGVITGALGGAYNLMGPVLVMTLQRARLPSQVFRATLHAFSVLANIAILLVFAFHRLLEPQLILHSALALPAMLVGGVLGGWIAARVDTQRYHHMVHLLLITLGVSLVVSELS